MEQPMTAYANFKKYAVRYDLEHHTFACWYTPQGLTVEGAAVQSVRFGEETFTPADFKTISFTHRILDDGTALGINYGGGPDCQRDFGIHFLLNDKGIHVTFGCRGDLDVRLAGKLRWGQEMEHETFAVNLNRQGQDLRSAHGPASSTVDNALFDRRTDSAVEIVSACRTRIDYDWAASCYVFSVSTGGHDYAKGFLLRFHRRVYEEKFQIEYSPVNLNTTFPDPPAGWMTWYAVQFDAGEKTVLENARWQSEHLKDFGANAVWVDWEWCHSDFSGRGKADTDIFHPDPRRYPHGLKHVADEIKALGLTPALWIGATNDPTENEFVKANPETVLVQKPNWCGQYFMDLTHPKVLQEYLPRVFRQIVDWGFEALKWDCMPLQIQLCDQYHDDCYNPELSTEQAMMGAVNVARSTVGRDFYMLYCAGLNDRDVSIAAAGFDAARIGGDIFRWDDFIGQCVARVMKLYALHNIVLLNDPDNVILREKFNTFDQAQSRLSFAALLGLPITLGDNLPDLDEARVELLRRGLPPLSTHPMDVRATVHDLKLVIANLAVNKPFEQWNIVDVFNLQEQETVATVNLEHDLHLDAEEGPYLVYDFWNKQFVGEVEHKFTMELKPCACKVFTVRRKLDRPQVLSTSRHISQGAYDIVDLRWDEGHKVLSGVSKVVAGDRYDIVLAFPEGFRMFTEGNDTCPADVQTIGRGLCMLSLHPDKTGELAWSAGFTPDFP